MNFFILLTLKNLKIKIELVEKYQKMDEDFQRNFHSRTAQNFHRNGHGSVRLMKYMAYCDRYYTNIKYFDLMGSILSVVYEISE